MAIPQGGRIDLRPNFTREETTADRVYFNSPLWKERERQLAEEAEAVRWLDKNRKELQAQESPKAA